MLEFVHLFHQYKPNIPPKAWSVAVARVLNSLL